MTQTLPFSTCVIRWQKKHGRHHLPWQKTHDPYRIWLSEIMLQQTQVATVIPYFHRFLGRFPDLGSLARASEESVLKLWSGLGYYSRGRNLLAAARMILRSHNGRFPSAFEDILALPGVGPSTAGAISVFAFGGRQPILDGNVRRLFTRVFGLEKPGREPPSPETLWTVARDLLPGNDIRAYTQGLMDLGATVCVIRSPRCAQCPLQTGCQGREGAGKHLLRQKRSAPKTKALHVRWLVLKLNKTVLLEKRIGKGIWRGLYSFPELPGGLAPAPFCWERWGLRIKNGRSLPAFRHVLTHRTLHLHPLLCQVVRGACPRSLRIFDASRVRTGALPAPVRRLLLESGHGPPLSKGKQLI